MITEFGNFNRKWNVGDIVVSIETIAGGYSLIAGRKYKIVDIGHANTTVKVIDFETENPNLYIVSDQWFFKERFIALEDWELYDDTKKYNL